MRSGPVVRRRLSGFEITFAEEVPAKDKEEVRLGRDSDIRRVRRNVNGCVVRSELNGIRVVSRASGDDGGDDVPVSR